MQPAEKGKVKSEPIPLPRPLPEPIPTAGLTLDQVVNATLLADPRIRAGLESINQANADALTAFGARPAHFAYPYGHAQAVGEREVELAREAGFATAVTTRHGVIMPGHSDHMLALPRISLNGRFQDTGHVRTMLSGLTTPLANRGKRLATL